MAAGEIYAQMGRDISNNLQQYQQIQSADSAAQGQIHAYMNMDPTGQNLSPDGKALMEKQMTGKASYQDRIKLMGEISTSQAMKQKQMEMQMERLKYNRMAYYSPGGPGFIGDDSQGQQGQPPGPPPGGMPQSQPQGQGGPPPGGMPPQSGQPSPAAAQMLQQQSAPQPTVGNTVLPPKTITVASPEIRALMPRLLSSTMGDPEKATEIAQKAADSMNQNNQKQYEQAVAKEAPTGRLVFTGAKYENGVPTFDNYAPETVKAQGTPVQSYGTGTQVVSFPHGTAPTQPVIFKPGEKTPTGAADSTATIAAASPFNPSDPGVQKTLVEAGGNVGQLQSRLGEANLLKEAAQAYAAGGSSKFNALRGDPKFARFAQLFSGSNPAAALQTALSANTSAILAQIKNPNNTTTGGRVLQTEFEGMSKLLGTGEMDNPSLLSAAYNNADLVQRMYDMEKSTMTYLHQMPQGDAVSKTLEQYNNIPLLAAAGKVQNIPKAKVQQLKSMLQAKYPGAIEFFKQKYGVTDKEAEIAILANAQ